MISLTAEIELAHLKTFFVLRRPPRRLAPYHPFPPSQTPQTRDQKHERLLSAPPPCASLSEVRITVSSSVVFSLYGLKRANSYPHCPIPCQNNLGLISSPPPISAAASPFPPFSFSFFLRSCFWYRASFSIICLVFFFFFFFFFARSYISPSTRCLSFKDPMFFSHVRVFFLATLYPPFPPNGYPHSDPLLSPFHSSLSFFFS